MTYSFRRILYITYLSIFKAKDTLARLTPKRIFVLLVFYTLYVFIEVLTWISFALDDLFFPGYRRQQVKQPVFIIGNPRSGTTFLHRLLARDTRNFSSIHLWEILFAPSVTQRKIAWAVADLDRALGGLLHRILHWFDRHFVSASNVMHKMSLVVPEEDEYFHVHQGATIIAGLFFGFPQATYPFVFFDTQLGRVEKRKVMRFYRHCLQRHIFAHQEDRAILSKNPFFSPKVDALYQRFPDAKIIYLARNPLKVVPSYASLSAHWWRMFAEPEKRYPHLEYILRSTQHWYRYPVERLEQAPVDSRALINFHELVADPHTVVTQMYQQLGLEMTPEFDEILRQESEKACRHSSRHKYSLKGVGFTKEQILKTYQDIYERWGFDPDII